MPRNDTAALPQRAEPTSTVGSKRASPRTCVVESVIVERYVSLSAEAVDLTSQRVPEGKTGKNRMHIDLLVDDVPAEVTRLESLGATRLTPAPGGATSFRRCSQQAS